MFLVGLTGGVGTGKSTTASMFRELGVPIIDCDQIAKQIVEPGRPAWKKIKVCQINVFIDSKLVVQNEIWTSIFTNYIYSSFRMSSEAM